MSRREPTIDAELETLQRQTFSYFVHETNPANGLVIDNTAPDWPASIAAVGLALAAYPEQGSAGGGYEDTKTCHSRSRRGTGGAELGPARPALTRAETPLT
jgi:hypothetical protein